jgi:hypothetical protein
VNRRRKSEMSSHVKDEVVNSHAYCRVCDGQLGVGRFFGFQELFWLICAVARQQKIYIYGQWKRVSLKEGNEI